MAATFDFLARSLSHDLGPSTLEFLERAVGRLRLNPERLSADEAVVVLKERVYTELQVNRSPDEAQARINEILEQLFERSGGFTVETELRIVESSLKKFNFYFEWPEVQRIRGLVKVVRREMQAGRDVSEMLWSSWQELDIAEEKLQLALLQQAREISELNSAYHRVKSIGGNQVRRLELLLEQIQAAQKNEILATAELERAQKLALELRKLVESSVVQHSRSTASAESVGPESSEAELDIDIDFDFLDEDQKAKLLELDLKEDRRLLEQLRKRFALIIDNNIEEDFQYLFVQLNQGHPLGNKIVNLSRRLDLVYKDALSENQATLDGLDLEIASLHEAGYSDPSLDALLEAVRGSLAEGVLPEAIGQLKNRIQHLQSEAQADQEADRQNKAILEDETLFINEANRVISRFKSQLKILPEMATFARGLSQLEASLAAGQPDPDTLAMLRLQFIGLTKILEEAIPDTDLLRTRLLNLLRSIPQVEGLEVLRSNLETRVLEGPDPDVETEIANLARRTREAMKQIVAEIRLQAEQSRIDLSSIKAAEDQLAAGGVPDIRLLQARINSQVIGRSAQNQREFERLLARARTFRGIGGERLEDQILLALTKPNHPQLNSGVIQQELSRLQARREDLRNELKQVFEVLESGYKAHRTVGGETALALRERILYLQQGIDRIDRLGVAGLMEIQRGLSDSQPLLERLRDEHQTAKLLAHGLQDIDLDSLLGIFDPEEAAGPEDSTQDNQLGIDTVNQIDLTFPSDHANPVDSNKVRADSYAELLNLEDIATTEQLKRWEALQFKYSSLKKLSGKLAPDNESTIKSLEENLQILNHGLDHLSSRSLTNLERLERTAEETEKLIKNINSPSTISQNDLTGNMVTLYEEEPEIPPTLQKVFNRLETSGATSLTLVENWQRVLGELAFPLGDLEKLHELLGRMSFKLNNSTTNYLSFLYEDQVLVVINTNDNLLAFICNPKLETLLIEEARKQIRLLTIDQS